MNPFHKGSFCLHWKAYKNGELTTSKADYYYETSMITLRKTFFLAVNRILPQFNYNTGIIG